MEPLIFQNLTLILSDPADGPRNMAIDEALLSRLAQSGEEAIIRFYTWTAPEVTFGYTQRHAEISAAFSAQNPPPPLTRRITGGGIVRHGNDLTFALAVHPAHPFAQGRPSQSYCQLHSSISAALADAGVATARTDAPGPARPGDCFAAPVRDDLLLPDGAKAVGGAQRRLRDGLLHQGTIQIPNRPATLARIIAARLARTIIERDVTTEEATVAENLARQKYRTNDWNTLR